MNNTSHGFRRCTSMYPAFEIIVDGLQQAVNANEAHAHLEASVVLELTLFLQGGCLSMSCCAAIS